MEFKKLGSTELKVSNVCLGTMTFGKQNTQAEAFEQMDYAFDAGVNFMDTAEMYAVPPTKETYGKTEEIIGNWIKEHPAKRAKTILMTKIAGPGVAYVREGKPYTAEDIGIAIDQSLQRLQTDYIDVFQLHWPNRPSPHFNRHWIDSVDFKGAKKAEKEVEANFLEVLKALEAAIDSGKIRHAGLSNESAWGIEKYIALAKAHNLKPMVSLQNEFSLLHSKDWPFVIESCMMNDLAYVPWSPLGGGVLSGKYANGARPEGSRWTNQQRKGIFRDQPAVHAAVEEYAAIAKELGITTAQLSLAWCNHLDWICAPIIGATSMSNLKENLEAFEIDLSEDALGKIEKVRRKYPIPF